MVMVSFIHTHTYAALVAVKIITVKKSLKNR